MENYSMGPEPQVKGEEVEQGRASFCHGDTGLLSGVSSEYVSHDYCPLLRSFHRSFGTNVKRIN